MKTMIALVLMMWAGIAAAQINKCVDKNGKVVGYGNECPAGSRAEQTGIKNTPAAPATSPQKSLVDRDADFRKRQVERQEAEAKAKQQAADSSQRSQACQEAQAYLKSVQAGQRIARNDPKTGERTFISDAEYPAEIARAQRAADSVCK